MSSLDPAPGDVLQQQGGVGVDGGDDSPLPSTIGWPYLGEDYPASSLWDDTVDSFFLDF